MHRVALGDCECAAGEAQGCAAGAGLRGLFGQSLAQFKKEVEERTRNAVTIEIFDNAKPYNDAQIVGAVTSGAMQLGVAGFKQFADKIPAIDILEQPFLFNFDALTNAAFSADGELRALIDKALLETIGRKRPLVVAGRQPGVLLEATGRRPATDQGQECPCVQ